MQYWQKVCKPSPFSLSRATYTYNETGYPELSAYFSHRFENFYVYESI